MTPPVGTALVAVRPASAPAVLEKCGVPYQASEVLYSYIREIIPVYGAETDDTLATLGLLKN